MQPFVSTARVPTFVPTAQVRRARTAAGGARGQLAVRPRALGRQQNRK